MGLAELRDVLRDRTTVLAGHSGVGKSSLIRAIQPQLDLRVGEVSRYTDKGRHTTTSARRYLLDFGGDGGRHAGRQALRPLGRDPGKPGRLLPDVAAGTAPVWRTANYERIATSLAG